MQRGKQVSRRKATFIRQCAVRCQRSCCWQIAQHNHRQQHAGRTFAKRSAAVTQGLSRCACVQVHVTPDLTCASPLCCDLLLHSGLADGCQPAKQHISCARRYPEAPSSPRESGGIRSTPRAGQPFLKGSCAWLLQAPRACCRTRPGIMPCATAHPLKRVTICSHQWTFLRQQRNRLLGTKHCKMLTATEGLDTPNLSALPRQARLDEQTD